MKLSENTLSILKNFASINSSILFREGKLQTTMAEDESILALCETDENFPEGFAVYDLNQFIGTIQAMDSPEITFDEKEKCASLIDEGFAVRYFGCEPSLFKSPPSDKSLKMENPDVSVNITEAILSKMIRLASNNILPHVSFVGENGEMKMVSHVKGNVTSNTVNIRLCDYNGKDFISTFKIENLKMLPGDYKLDIKIDKFAKFTSKDERLHYFVALVVK